jgi:hypothetical protein
VGRRLVKLRHDLVLVTWDDAAELNLGWMEESEVVAKPMLVRTVGFIIRKNKQHIIVASTIGDFAHCHAQFQIPRKMVQSIHVIARRGSEFPTAETTTCQHDA